MAARLIRAAVIATALAIAAAPIAIEHATAQARPTHAPMRVTVASDGSVRLDGIVVDLGALERHARARASSGAVITADESVAYARVIEVMDALVRAGVSNVSIAGPARPEN